MIRSASGRSLRAVVRGCRYSWNGPKIRRLTSSSSSSSIGSTASITKKNDAAVPSNTKPHRRTNSGATTKVMSSLSNNHNCMEYAKGWAWQQVLLSHRLHTRRQLKLQLQQQQEQQKQNPTLQNESDPNQTLQQPILPQDDDFILLLEHAPVYTLGRGASEEHLTFLATNANNDNDNDGDTAEISAIRERLSRKYRGNDAARLSVDRRAVEDKILSLPMPQAVDLLTSKATPVLAPNGVPVYRVDRGGEVTFHGPSQLVVYPVFDLKRDPYQADLHWFLRGVEDVVIQTLKHYGIEGVRDEINTGVWVDETKIAAVGVSASSWLSSHGFALNVSPDLTYFDTSVILPCGIEGRGVTSIQEILQHQQQQRGETTSLTTPSVAEVAEVVLQSMEDVFQIEIDKNVQHIGS